MTGGDRVTGGYQAVASVLTSMFHYPLTRQQVYMWWTRRAVNGFPEGQRRPAVRGDRDVQEFRLDDVVAWFEINYPESRRERVKWLRQVHRVMPTTASEESSTT